MKKQLGIAAGVLFLAGLGTFLYATRIEAHAFRLEKVRLRTRTRAATAGGASPPKNFKRFKILHLSDLHMHHPESKKIDFLRKITEEDYDLIVFTGDIFEDFSGLPYISQIITKHGRLGTYAVLGNHDYYDYSMKNKILGRIYRKWRHPPDKRDVTPIVEAVTAAGIKVMRNESIRFSEERLHLIGLDYPGTTDQRMQEMISEAEPGDFIMSLFHVPRRLDRHSRAGVHLGMAGHTHGGQIRIPGYGALITDSELSRAEASGLVWKGDTAFHVSRGLSADPRTNIRFNCPPVATELEVTHVFDSNLAESQR